MKPSDRRKRLFRTSRPHIRPAALLEEGQYGYDMGILWAAYKAGSFPLVEDRDMTNDDFAKYILAHAMTLSSMVIVEDDSKAFESGRGPVAVVGIRSDGWTVEPHVDFFEWAAPRTMLRVVVAFMQMVRYSKDVGVCVVKCLKTSKSLFKHVSDDYGVLHPVGMIPKGSPRGDVLLYSVWGGKE